MTINATGQISFGGTTQGESLQYEFSLSGTATLALGSLYRGGSYVRDIPLNSNVPTSGTLALSNFRGFNGRYVTPSITVPNNSVNYIIGATTIPGYVAGMTNAVYTITSNYYVGANSLTQEGAIVINDDLIAGDTIYINNFGYILGCGGTGGGGTSGTTQNGFNGGPAIKINTTKANVYIYNANTGVIGAGGGGGGRGSFGYITSFSFRGGSTTSWNSSGGGGGGAGYYSAGGAASGTATGPANNYRYASGGSAGSTLSGGGGGGGSYGHWYTVAPNTYFYGGSGGGGGNIGANGGGGGLGGFGSEDYGPGTLYLGSSSWIGNSTYGYPYGSGGTAGYAISGSSKAKVISNAGTIYGSNLA